jgi:hypothetical protein
MLMCGGHADPEVSFANAQLTNAYFAAHGVAANLVSVLDVDTAATAGDPYAVAKAAFVAARQRVVSAGGNPSTRDNYHGDLVFIACMSAANIYFAGF